jgi:hypothetical protein
MAEVVAPLLHAYVPPPLVVSEVLVPAQMLVFPVITGVKEAPMLTVATLDVTELQPLPVAETTTR